MLSMMNASPRTTSQELHDPSGSSNAAAANPADEFTGPVFPRSDQENFSHDAQAFAMRPQKPLPVQVSLVKNADKYPSERSTRTEPRAIAIRSVPLNPSGAASSTVNKQTTSAQRREKRSTKSKCSPGLRSGKWTPEEEAYTNMIIHYFKRGLLDIDDGTSLRWFLAKRLNCEAMRVTKKLKGNSSIGKQIFRALENTPDNRMAILHAKDELDALEKLFLESLTAANQSGSSSVSSPSAYLNAAIRHSKGALHAEDIAGGRPAHAPRSSQEEANLLLNFFAGAHDSADSPPPRQRSEAKANHKHGLNASVKLEKKRPFESISASDEQWQPESGEDVEAEPDASPSKRRSVKIEDLMG